MTPRQVAVIGAGGVGGLFAAMLARAGHDVRVLARGAALAAIRERGIATHGPDGDHVVRVARASDDASELGDADVVLVTVKTWQLAELGPRLAPLVGARTLVVPAQNGIEASEVLARALGDAHVIGGVCNLLSWAEAPGEIRWIGGPPIVTIGALRADQTDGVREVGALLATGGIDARVTHAIEGARWQKFLFLAPYAAVGAACRVPLGVLRGTPSMRARLEAAMHEVAALAASRGVELPADAVAAALARIEVLPADAMTSMHRDMAAGKPSELHELIGAVVRFGREAGVATPVSAALYAELEPLEAQARGRAQPGS